MSAVGGLVQGEGRGRWLVGAAACAAALAWAAAPARAADGVIPGNPLTILANDNGQLQVVFPGSSTGEFFPPSAAPANAGLNIALTPVVSPGPLEVRGFLGVPFQSVTPAAPPAVTGDGSAGNPWVLTTSFATNGPSTNPSIRVNETLIYVNGSSDVTARYEVVNQSDSQALRVRVSAVGDLFVAGNDQGVGFFDPGPPRQVGGINQAAGSSGRLVEVTPWSHYQEGRYSDVFSVVSSSDETAQGFNDTIDPALLDNGAGVQWDIPNLPLPGSQTIEVTWRFRHFTPLTLALLAATKAQGQVATATVTARNGDGNPDVGRSVRYAVAGANPGAGAVTTGADGNAVITWAGANLGLTPSPRSSTSTATAYAMPTSPSRPPPSRGRLRRRRSPASPWW